MCGAFLFAPTPQPFMEKTVRACEASWGTAAVAAFFCFAAPHPHIDRTQDLLYYGTRPTGQNSAAVRQEV
jgi:hypothetical protein